MYKRQIKNSGIELEKLSYQIANWNRVQAQNRMEQLISQYQNKICLLYTSTPDMKNKYVKAVVVPVKDSGVSGDIVWSSKAVKVTGEEMCIRDSQSGL